MAGFTGQRGALDHAFVIKHPLLPYKEYRSEELVGNAKTFFGSTGFGTDGEDGSGESSAAETEKRTQRPRQPKKVPPNAVHRQPNRPIATSPSNRPALAAGHFHLRSVPRTNNRRLLRAAKISNGKRTADDAVRRRGPPRPRARRWESNLRGRSFSSLPDLFPFQAPGKRPGKIEFLAGDADRQILLFVHDVFHVFRRKVRLQPNRIPLDGISAAGFSRGLNGPCGRTSRPMELSLNTICATSCCTAMDSAAERRQSIARAQAPGIHEKMTQSPVRAKRKGAALPGLSIL